MTRRGWFVVLALGLGARAFGCRRRERSEGPTGPSRTGPIGYSHVLRLDGPRAEAVLATGARFVMAELGPSGAPLAGVVSAAEVVRRRGGQLLLVGLNWNDEAARRQPESWWVDHVHGILAAVGTRGVWFEPIAEPWVGETERASRWSAIGARIWREAGGTVVGPLPHPCDAEAVEAMIHRRQITVTDCTPVLASRVAPEQLRAWFRLALELDVWFLAYDTFETVPWNDGIVALLQDVLAT